MGGQGAVAGGAALGLGALAFYGLGMSSEAGAVDRAVAWPQYVRDRVRDTYFYFGSSLAATAGTAAAIYRSPAAMNLVNRGGFIAMGVSIAAMIGSSMVARSIPYTPGVGAKQAAWPWVSASSSVPASPPTSCHPPPPWVLACTASLSMVALSCSAPSCCTTPRK